ncbi:MAG TPA: NAD(P)-dependent oxidoreductase, partial [Devosia sp.]|nr:NAD(P)-dependent oxidoreductase [Devosia sp.]
KHGVESVLLRIGSCLPRPSDIRQLSTWLSHPDLARLILAALTAETPGCAIVWGISNNKRAWWSGDDAARIGYRPEDDAEVFAGEIAESDEHQASAHYQGGGICAIDYSRDPTLLDGV